MAVLPPSVAQKLADQGIDLGMFSTMKDENIDEVLRELNMVIEKGNGKKMQIYCE